MWGCSLNNKLLWYKRNKKLLDVLSYVGRNAPCRHFFPCEGKSCFFLKFFTHLIHRKHNIQFLNIFKLGKYCNYVTSVYLKRSLNVSMSSQMSVENELIHRYTHTQSRKWYKSIMGGQHTKCFTIYSIYTNKWPLLRLFITIKLPF